MKIYKVTFNDGGWHTELPNYYVVAISEKEAIKKVLMDNPRYEKWDSWATEFKIDGYIIEVYDEKSYSRDKQIEEIL